MNNTPYLPTAPCQKEWPPEVAAPGGHLPSDMDSDYSGARHTGLAALPHRNIQIASIF